MKCKSCSGTGEYAESGGTLEPPMTFECPECNGNGETPHGLSDSEIALMIRRWLNTDANPTRNMLNDFLSVTATAWGNHLHKKMNRYG